jgi:Na+/melibiose symporter-like transporter
VIGSALGASGFAPNQPQGETTLLTLRALLSLFPFVCYAAGAWLFLGFRLDRAEHARVQREIGARSCAAAA